MELKYFHLIGRCSAQHDARWLEYRKQGNTRSFVRSQFAEWGAAWRSAFNYFHIRGTPSRSPARGRISPVKSQGVKIMLANISFSIPRCSDSFTASINQRMEAAERFRDNVLSSNSRIWTIKPHLPTYLDRVLGMGIFDQTQTSRDDSAQRPSANLQPHWTARIILTHDHRPLIVKLYIHESVCANEGLNSGSYRDYEFDWDACGFRWRLGSHRSGPTMRAEIDFSSRINAICTLSSPHRKNKPVLSTPKSAVQPSRSGPPRGAYRDRHGRWAWNAVDAAAPVARMRWQGELWPVSDRSAADERR